MEIEIYAILQICSGELGCNINLVETPISNYQRFIYSRHKINIDKINVFQLNFPPTIYITYVT